MTLYADYRYLLTDLVTQQIIGEIQFVGVQWSLELNGAGSFDGSININDARLEATLGTFGANYYSGLLNATQPARTGLYVERNGALVWGGIIWTRTWDSQAQQLSVSARTFESYLDHRIVKSRDASSAPGADVLAYDDTTDQFQVLVGPQVAGTGGGVITNMIAVTNDIGLTINTGAASGVTIPGQLVIFDYEQKMVSQVVQDLATQTTAISETTGQTYNVGFDWAINVYYDSSYNIVRSFDMYYPARGKRDLSDTTLPLLEFPGSVISYNWPEDGTSVITTIFGIGAGSADGQYVSVRGPSVYNVGGYPTLEAVESFTYMPDPSAVDMLTQARADARAEPVVTPSFAWLPAYADVDDLPIVRVGSSTLPTTTGPAIGEFEIGDIFRIRLNDAYFYGGAEKYLRLIKYVVNVGDSNNAEMVTGDFSVATY